MYVLDGYRILRELHASTRSQVYQVEDIETGEQFCMKTPSVNFEDDPAYIERFVMERLDRSAHQQPLRGPGGGAAAAQGPASTTSPSTSRA